MRFALPDAFLFPSSVLALQGFRFIWGVQPVLDRLRKTGLRSWTGLLLIKCTDLYELHPSSTRRSSLPTFLSVTAPWQRPICLTYSCADLLMLPYGVFGSAGFCGPWHSCEGSSLVQANAFTGVKTTAPDSSAQSLSWVQTT